MLQRWSDLLFLHWQWDAADLQSRLPVGLHIDTFDGKAWLGIVPFFMERIRPRLLPPLPWMSWFLELNVRTYVHDDKGRPGVSVSLARLRSASGRVGRPDVLPSPYQHAAMRGQRAGGKVQYHCRRKNQPSSAAADFEYTLASPAHAAAPGSLEFFLIERYLLFSSTPNGLRTGQVHHQPYQIATPRLDTWSGAPLQWNGWPTPTRPPDHALGSSGVDVEVFSLEGCAGLERSLSRLYRMPTTTKTSTQAVFITRSHHGSQNAPVRASIKSEMLKATNAGGRSQ